MNVLSVNAQRGGLPADEQPPTPTYLGCDPLSENNPCIQTSCETELRPPISTNPAHPVNVLRPELVNRFKWTDETYPIAVLGLPNSIIENPVYQDGNIVLQNRFGGLDRKDIKPEDGWELIRRDLGGVQSPTGLPMSIGTPYIILYNRYSSILRVFIARGPLPYRSSYTKIILRMNGINVSSLFDNYKNGYIAIDKPYQGVEVTGIMQVFDAGGKWGYADFALNYDPCTCFFTDNTLSIEVKTVEESTMNLTGTATARIATDIQTGSSYSGVFDDGVNVSKNYVKGFTSFQKFLDESKKIVDLTHVGTDSAVGTAKAKKKALDDLQKIIDNNSLLREGLKTVPYVSLALSIYDMYKGMSGNTTSPTPTKLAPMTFNSQMKISGNITTENRYDGITLQTPGASSSNIQTNQIPAYNEVLGVFNLLKTPVIEQFIVSQTREGFYGVSYDVQSVIAALAEPIQYTLNPAAGVEIQDISLQLGLVVKPTLGPGFISEIEVNSTDPDGTKNYVSEIKYGNSNPLLTFKKSTISSSNRFPTIQPEYYIQITVNN